MGVLALGFAGYCLIRSSTLVPEFIHGDIADSPPAPKPIRTGPPQTKKADQSLYRAAIIIDDLGFNAESTEMVLSLGIPLTVSVLPFYPFSREAAERSREGGKEVLLHLPMEPKGYPDLAHPGNGVLLIGMTRGDIIVQLEKDITAVPHVAGVSSHMGSRFTADLEGMRVVANWLKKRGLFFVDNLTTNRSVGRDVAREAGLRYLERDIFLDDDLHLDRIEGQLEKVEVVARKFGKVVAVGHPHRNTISALRSWIPRARAGGITFVHASALLENDGNSFPAE